MNGTTAALLATTINHGPGSLRIAPPHVNMRVADELRIRIVPHVPPRGARTRGVTLDGAPQGELDWLNVETKDGQELVITVPDHVEPGQQYKYSIEIDGVGMLDPSITIIR